MDELPDDTWGDGSGQISEVLKSPSTSHHAKEVVIVLQVDRVHAVEMTWELVEHVHSVLAKCGPRLSPLKIRRGGNQQEGGPRFTPLPALSEPRFDRLRTLVLNGLRIRGPAGQFCQICAGFGASQAVRRELHLLRSGTNTFDKEAGARPDLYPMCRASASSIWIISIPGCAV